MRTDMRVMTSSAPLVALASWLVPGAGYWLIGQRGRALGVGITITVLFILGLLVGGVRVIEVPGYSINTGERQMITMTGPVINPKTNQVYVDRNGAEVIEPVMVPAVDPITGQKVIDPNSGRTKLVPLRRWALLVSPLIEVRDKPWSVPQIMTGPIAIVAGAFSVYAAGPVDETSKLTIGALTHARINELGSLYLSVAGLLNLMVIIDATWRASHMVTKPAEAAA